MFAKFRESVEDVSPSTIVIVATAAVVGGVLLASSRNSDGQEPFASSNARSSNHLWLPDDHYLFRKRTTSPPLTITTNSPASSSSSSSPPPPPTFFFSSSSDEKESLLRRKLETAVRREEKLRTVLKELTISGDSLSFQIQELLQSRGEGKEGGGGGAATMLGKTRDAVARERQQFIQSQQVEARGLRIKLANLEQQSYLTKKALEKSKEQTGIHTNSFHSLRGERATSPRSPSDKTQWSVVPSFHDAVTQMRYELLRLDNDSMKKIQMNISKIQQSKEETSTIMLQSLYLCKSGFEEYCQLDSFTKISSAWNVSQIQLSNMPRSECSTLFCIVFGFCFCFSSFCICTKDM